MDFERFVCLLGLIASSSLGNPLQATSIEPGFDLFVTQPGTSVDLSGFGLGTVPLEGVPIGPGNTDTIVERLQGINPLNQPAGEDTIDIELVALQLKSVEPVDLTPLGGPFIGVFSDLYTTVNKGGIIPGLPQPDALQPSIGQMHIFHTVPDGGLFDSCFGALTDPGACGPALNLGVAGGGVFADALFVITGGDPANPLDVLLNTPAPRVTLSSQGSTWSHTPPPLDPHTLQFPAGEFYVTAIAHEGPHLVEPSETPEPSTLILVGAGLLGLLFKARNQRRLS